MGASKILVCRVDYDNAAIKLGRWLRAYEGVSNPLLEDLKVRLDLTRVSRAEAMSEVEGHRTPVALFAAGMSFKSLMPFVSVRESIELVKVFDETALRSGIRPRIVAEGEAERLIEAGAFVFFPPSPSKADVVESGLSRNLLPPKSTRHLIPARPVGVSFPLRWLMERGLSVEEANRRLASLVAESRIVTHASGLGIHGSHLRRAPLPLRAGREGQLIKVRALGVAKRLHGGFARDRHRRRGLCGGAAEAASRGAE